MLDRLKLVAKSIALVLVAFSLTAGLSTRITSSTSRSDILQSNTRVTSTKVAVSALGPSLDSMVDNRFGRCQYFIIIEPDTMQFEALKNPYTDAVRGAGISAAQMILEEEVQVVITGNIGPNAFQALLNAGIQVFSARGISVRNAVQQYKAGQLSSISAPTTMPRGGQGGKRKSNPDRMAPKSLSFS